MKETKKAAGTLFIQGDKGGGSRGVKNMSSLHYMKILRAKFLRFQIKISWHVFWTLDPPTPYRLKTPEGYTSKVYFIVINFRGFRR